MRELGRAEDGRDDHWRLFEVLVEEVDPHLAAAADEGAGNCRTVLPQLALFGDLHLNVLLRAAVMAHVESAALKGHRLSWLMLVDCGVVRPLLRL